MSEYIDFARVYDLLTREIDYAARGAYFDKVIQKHGGTHGILLDLGCGTGTLSEVMTGLGYDVIGVDNSPTMLMAAFDRRAETGSAITYLCQDMTRLDLFGTVDVVLSALDSLNHLTRYEDFCRAIKKAAFFLHPDGVVVFDLNTVYKHRHVLASNTFVYDMNEVYCVWQNTLKENDLVEMSLDIFVPDEEGRYDRMEDGFAERAYSHEQVLAALYGAGLRLEAVYHEDTFEDPRPDSQRLIYVARLDPDRQDIFRQSAPKDDRI